MALGWHNPIEKWWRFQLSDLWQRRAGLTPSKGPHAEAELARAPSIRIICRPAGPLTEAGVSLDASRALRSPARLYLCCQWLLRVKLTLSPAGWLAGCKSIAARPRLIRPTREFCKHLTSGAPQALYGVASLAQTKTRACTSSSRSDCGRLGASSAENIRFATNCLSTNSLGVRTQ